jgi:hypothetical protein
MLLQSAEMFSKTVRDFYHGVTMQIHVTMTQIAKLTGMTRVAVHSRVNKGLYGPIAIRGHKLRLVARENVELIHGPISIEALQRVGVYIPIGYVEPQREKLRGMGAGGGEEVE